MTIDSGFYATDAPWSDCPNVDGQMPGVVTFMNVDRSCTFALQFLPITVPDRPVIERVEAGDGEILIHVVVPFDGGSEVTLYSATCTDGTNILTGASTSSPITVSGLTNGVAYTCSVTATNSVGTSSASAATDPITPEEASTGLPIWLLYQATQ